MRAVQLLVPLREELSRQCMDGPTVTSCRRLGRVASHLAASTGTTVQDSTAKPIGEVEPQLSAWAPQLPGLIDQFCRDGFCVVSGLFTPAVCAAAVEATWAAMEESSRTGAIDKRPGNNWLSPTGVDLKRSDEGTWPGYSRYFESVKHPDIGAMFTPAYRAMAEALSNAAAARQPEGRPLIPNHVPIAPREGALAIVIGPKLPGADGWQMPKRGHIDHSSPEFDALPMLPVRMACMTYLTDSPDGDGHGGSTIVWPGSHAVLADIAASDPERYSRMRGLADAIYKDHVLDHIVPVEVKVNAGDVLL